MKTHLGLALLVVFAASFAAAGTLAAGEKPNVAAAKETRAAADAALQKVSQAKTETERRDALRKLAELGRDIKTDDRLNPSQKSVLLAPIRERLAKAQRDLAKDAARQPKGVEIPADRDGVLAQPGAGGAAGDPAKPGDNGNDLAEVIQSVISPGTWERNGGNGVIVYFGARQSLIVRAPSEVHGGLADLMEQLHGK